MEQDLWSHSSRAAEDETRSDFHMIAGVALHRYTPQTPDSENNQSLCWCYSKNLSITKSFRSSALDEVLK